MNPFRRSGAVGLVGVVIVAVAVAIVALKMGQDQAKPKHAMALIFAIIGAYIVILFIFQSLDLSRGEAAESHAVSVADIDNPATLDEPTLWEALAVEPIDSEAVRARSQVWETTRSSMHLGWIVCALIFLIVPPIYLLDTFVPLLVGLPVLFAIVLWRSVRLLIPGGDLDRAYELAGKSMAPLGLRMEERPEVSVGPKGVAPYRMGTIISGGLVLDGERHGRHVVVSMSGDGARPLSEVTVEARAPAFEFKTRDGRLRALDGAPDWAREALTSVPNSTRWNGVSGAADGAITVSRKGTGTGDWLMDL